MYKKPTEHQTYQNYTRLFNRESKSQKSLDRCHPDEHKCHARLAKLSITRDGETKIFHDKTKFKQRLSTIPTLQGIIEE